MWAASFRDWFLFPFHAIDHLDERLIGMRANYKVAASEDVGGYCVDPYRLGLTPVVVDDSFVAALLDGEPQFDWVKPHFLTDTNEVVDIFEPACELPMGFEQRVMHLVELALLTRELSGAERAARIDYHIALPHHQAHLFRDFAEAAPDLR
jgi:hypothetical protein